jgi:6,7-dimethyl-8-ribityllumazine synthase
MRITEVQGGVPEHLRVGVVVSSFNQVITDGLLQGALEALETAGTGQVTLVRVPGALEIPVAARRLIETGHDAVVALAAVIRGETDHYEHVAAQSIAGLARLAASTGVPIGNAVLTVTEFDHARQRSLPGPGNKGHEAAMAALTMVGTLRRIVPSGEPGSR